MKKEFYYGSSDGVTSIHAAEWIPDGEVKAVLQISHGMVEHVSRYDRFARYLNRHGIYVTGNDHLGHGDSVTGEEKRGYFGHPYGNEHVIRDIHKLRIRTGKKYPDAPYFMLGHSMGSFLIRQYMMLHGTGLSGVIVMGTGAQPKAALQAGKLVCRAIAACRGWEYRSKRVDRLIFSSYNKRFQPGRTGKEWLTKDEAVIDAYRADPRCSFLFTLNGFYQMFRGIQFVQKKENVSQIPKDLPIFFVAGANDPVGRYGKSVRKVKRAYESAGISDVKIKIYETDRHEILNETDYKTVFSDLRRWMEKRI